MDDEDVWGDDDGVGHVVDDDERYDLDGAGPTAEQRRALDATSLYASERDKFGAVWPCSLLDDVARAPGIPERRGPGCGSEVDDSAYVPADLLPLRAVVYAWFLVVERILPGGSMPRLATYDGPFDGGLDWDYREHMPAAQAGMQLSLLEWFPDPPVQSSLDAQFEFLIGVRQSVERWLPRARRELLVSSRPALLVESRIRGRELPLHVVLFAADPEGPEPTGSAEGLGGDIRAVQEAGSDAPRTRRNRRRSHREDVGEVLAKAFEYTPSEAGVLGDAVRAAMA